MTAFIANRLSVMSCYRDGAEWEPGERLNYVSKISVREREREKSARKRNGEIMCAKMVTCRLCSSAADDASCLPPERHIHWMCDDVQRSLFVASPECIRWMFNRIEVPMAGYRCANEITRRTFDAAHSSNRSWCLFGKHPVQWTLLHRRLSYSKTSRDLRRLVTSVSSLLI